MTVHFERVVRGFSRYNKYTVGTDLRNYSRAVLVLVARANTLKYRIESLEQAIDKLQQLKIVLHVCMEEKVFKSFDSCEFAIKSVVDVSKQCEGWLRSQNSAGMKPAGVS